MTRHEDDEVAGDVDDGLDPRTRRTLAEFLDFAAAGARLVERGRSAWEDDEFLRLAGESIMHRIGEAITRLDRDDPDFVRAHPHVGWRPMKGMRNTIAHQYEIIDYDIIWNGLADRLPDEAAKVRLILGPDS